VHPESGRSYWLILPTVNLETMKIALDNFSKAHNPGNKKIIILLIDRAGFHKLPEEDIPAGLVLYKLPAYSPELQPAEPLWPLIKEPVANKYFNSMEEMEDVLVDRCNWLRKNTDVVKGASGFRWIFCTL
jgi:transposase